MKRLLAILITVMMLCSFTSFAVAEEPMVISLMLQDHVHSIMNNDIYTFKTIGEKFGVTFDFQLTPSDAIAEKRNMVLGGKPENYPDIMVADPKEMAQYYDTGIFVELTDLIPEKIPNFLTAAEKADPYYLKNIKTDDGKLWYVTKIEYSNYNLFPYINQDWLDELGLAMPTTVEELYDVFVKFKEAKAADGNIIWAAGPWESNKIWKTMMQYFGTDEKWLHPAEGSFVYGPYERAENTKAALEFMHKCYVEGIMDPDWISRDDDSINAKINAGEVGFFITWGDNGNTWGKGGISGTNYAMPGPLATAAYGDPYVEPNTLIGGSYFIMNKGDQAKLDKICEVLNYIYSDEGAALFSFGEEGVTYTLEDGKPVFTDTILKHELGGVNGRRTMGINPNPFPHVSLDTAWGQLVGQISNDALEAHKKSWDLAEPVLAPTVDEAAEETQLFADIHKYANSCIAKFITGEMDLEKDWDTYLKTLEDLGVARYIEIVHGEYERWLAR